MHSVFFAAQQKQALKLRPVFIHKILVVARNMGLFSLAMEASSLPNIFHDFNFKGINYWVTQCFNFHMYLIRIPHSRHSRKLYAQPDHHLTYHHNVVLLSSGRYVAHFQNAVRCTVGLLFVPTISLGSPPKSQCELMSSL